MPQRSGDGLVILRWWFEDGDPAIRCRIVLDDAARVEPTVGQVARGTDDVIDLLRDLMTSLERVAAQRSPDP